MGLFDWIGKRADNFENIGNWTVDRLGKTGEWTNHALFGNDSKGSSSGKKSNYVGPSVSPISQYYKPENYNFSSVPGYRGWNTQGDPWVTADAASNDSTNGYNAAAYVQSLLNSIEESFNRQRGQLDANKASSAANIQKNYDAFKQGVANNQALYQQGSQAIQAEIARRASEAAARNAELGKQIGAAVGGIGGNASIPQNQVAANAASLSAAQGFQQDLAKRLDQIVGANQRAVENSGDLVRQGATGNLENSYNQVLNALMAQREQQIAQAQSAGSSGGGRSSGSSSNSGTDYSKMYKQAVDKQRLEWMLNGYTPTESELLNSMIRAGGSDATAALTYLGSKDQQSKSK